MIKATTKNIQKYNAIQQLLNMSDDEIIALATAVKNNRQPIPVKVTPTQKEKDKNRVQFYLDILDKTFFKTINNTTKQVHCTC